MPNSNYTINISPNVVKTPCSEYYLYTGTTHVFDSATPINGGVLVSFTNDEYTLSLSVDSTIDHVFLFVEHCDEHVDSVPSSTPKRQGGYQVLLLDLRCETCGGTPSTPTPTPTVTITLTPTQTITPTVTETLTPTLTVTPTLDATLTPTLTPTLTVTPTLDATLTPTVTPTFTLTPTLTITQSVTPTHTPTVTETITPTLTVTPTYTPTVTETITPTPTPTEVECNCYTLFQSVGEVGSVSYISCVGDGQSVTLVLNVAQQICSQTAPVPSSGDIVITNNGACSDGVCPASTCECVRLEAPVSDFNTVYVAGSLCGSNGTVTSISLPSNSVTMVCLEANSYVSGNNAAYQDAALTIPINSYIVTLSQLSSGCLNGTDCSGG